MSQAASKPERSQAARKVGRHRIRKAIERMILEGRFRPGEKLVQFQLAKKFGVSQGLIREALFELKEFGLVETSDNRGMFVRSLDARSIYEMLVIREVFDGVAARECCGRISAEDAAKLRKTRLTDNRILMMWAQQHHVLGKVVGNARTIAPEETRRGHYAIIDAILSGDRDLAERAAREHVLAAWPTFEASLTRGPGSVLWLTGDKHAKKR
jgi:DNA-binding GntR family transcriptional regulator